MQQIIQGIGTLPTILKQFGCKRLFLVTDASFPFLSIRNTIDGLDVEKVMFSDFAPNPVFEDICKGLEQLKLSGCDTILAIGGGSAIDVAKCLKLAFLASEGQQALIPPLVSTQLPIDGRLLPFLAIPTTAGTGSESTHNAVMYYEGNKQTVMNDAILPDIAILEPETLHTLPLYQKKCTMMDALCQGIESWWSVKSTDESKKYSKIAISTIMAYWRPYIFENDTQAAAKIMLAANYAGRAINIAQTTAAHAMSYKITSLYRLPHGHAVAVCLPEIWEWMTKQTGDCIDSRGKAYVADIFQQIAESMGASTASEAILMFRNIFRELGLQNPVSANRSEELEMLSHSVNPVRLKNNPIGITDETARNLYETIVK